LRQNSGGSRWLKGECENAYFEAALIRVSCFGKSRKKREWITELPGWISNDDLVLKGPETQLESKGEMRKEKDLTKRGGEHFLWATSFSPEADNDNRKFRVDKEVVERRSLACIGEDTKLNNRAKIVQEDTSRRVRNEREKIYDIEGMG